MSRFVSLQRTPKELVAQPFQWYSHFLGGKDMPYVNTFNLKSDNRIRTSFDVNTVNKANVL